MFSYYVDIQVCLQILWTEYSNIAKTNNLPRRQKEIKKKK